MENESDIARIARLSGLKPEQVRYDLKEHCILKGNQLEVTISDDEALKIISEKRNMLIWIDSSVKPTRYPFMVSNDYEIVIIRDIHDEKRIFTYSYEHPFSKWAYITPDMLPKGGIS